VAIVVVDTTAGDRYKRGIAVSGLLVVVVISLLLVLVGLELAPFRTATARA
jgi:hypothetical protein